MKVGFILTAILLGLPVAASAQELPPLTGRDVALNMKPTAPERFFPEAAQKANVEGEATALCTISRKGDLTDCQVTQETPLGYQFGDAVVRVAGGMRVSAKTKDGSPTEGRRFQLHMYFRLPPTH